MRLDSARRELSRIALDREVSPSAAVPLADGRWAIVASGGRESRLLRLAGDGTLEAPWPAMTVRDHLAPMAPLRGGGFAVLDVSHGAHPRLLRFSADGQAAAHPLPSGRNRGALTCDHHDRCVVVDTARSGQLLARRYGPDGRLDPAYGSRWPRTTAPADAQAAAFDSHGRLLVAAHAHPRAIVTRLDRRGRPDRTFGRNGHVVLRRPNGSWIDIPTGIAQTRRGIVVAGWSDNDANFREDYEPPRVLVARLRS